MTLYSECNPRDSITYTVKKKDKIMGDTYPKFKAAVAQVSPVFLDREATKHVIL
jgi:hypothetical protein